MDTCMLTYDIPVGTKMGNPSAQLQGLGFVRINLSVWVGTLGSLAEVPLDEWTGAGVKATAVRFLPEEWPAVRLMAHQALEREADATTRFVEVQSEKAQVLYAEAEKLVSTRAVVRAHTRMRTMIREAGRRIRAAEVAALQFGLLRERSMLWEATRTALVAHQSAFMANRVAMREMLKAQQVAR